MGESYLRSDSGLPSIRVMLLPAFLVSFLGAVHCSCSVGSSDPKADANDPANFQASCVKALEEQVKIEFQALSSTFSWPLTSTRTLSTFLTWPAYSGVTPTERSHAIQFVQYLRMRGAENNDFFGGNPIQPKERAYTWSGVDEALRMALKMEKDVTGRMKKMIDICSATGQDDPHAADWLTGTWLEEQLQGQRSLAGLINTFNNFKRGHEELAEWMFDQEL